MSKHGAAFQKGVKDSKGNISPKGQSSNQGSTVEELSTTEEVRKAKIDGETVVAELSEGRVRQKESGEKVFGVSLDSEKARKFFTEEELAKLESADSLSNPDKDTETEEMSYSDMQNQMRDEINEIYKQEVKEHKLEQAKSTESRDWMKPEHETKTVSEMTGSEFKQAMSEAMSQDTQDTEELQQSHDTDLAELLDMEEPEPEIKQIDTETEEMAISSFRERANKKGKTCWEDLAEDLEMSDSHTTYETLSSDKKRITTKDEELQSHLKNPEGFNGSVRIEQESDNVVVAVVSRE